MFRRRRGRRRCTKRKREQEFSVIKSCGRAPTLHTAGHHHMCVWRAGNTLLRLLLLPRSPSISFFVAVPAHTGFPLLSMCYCVYIRCVRALSPALLLCFFFLLSFCLLSRPTRETVASLTAALLYPVNWLTENVGWELVCALDLPVFCVCVAVQVGASREKGHILI